MRGCLRSSELLGWSMAETLEQVTAERDALRAEVERLRAALPKWRQSGDDTWILDLFMRREVSYVHGDHFGFWHVCSGLTRFHTRDAAMRVAEAELCLPVCEVVND